MSETEDRYYSYAGLFTISTICGGFAIYATSISLLGILSIITTIILIGVTEEYKRKFEYPLVFIRDSINYWSAGFSVFISLMLYFVVDILINNLGIRTEEVPALAITLFSIVAIAIILHTGSVMTDTNGDD